MNIKQQSQIKAFLIEELGKDKGTECFSHEEKILEGIIANTKNKTENQLKTLIQTILPRIALYKALSENGFSEDKECIKWIKSVWQ